MIARINYKFVLSTLVSILLSVFLFCFLKNTLFAALLSCYVFILAFSVCNYGKNIMFLAFLICFFVFLIGRPFVIEVFGYSKYSAITLNQESRDQMYICMLVSLISLALGYFVVSFLKKNKIRKKKKEQAERSGNVLAMMMISKYITIALYLFVIVENIIRLVTVREIGYTASYALDYDYGLPFGLHNLVIIAPVSLAIFLATLPDKKEIRIPIVLFVLANLLSSFAGNRFEIISCVLLLVVYGVWRSIIDGGGWVTKKYIIWLIVLAPIVMVLMQQMTYWRDGLESNNDIGPVASFLYGTGGSSDLIGATHQYGDRVLRDDVLYTFGGVWRGLNGNIVSQKLGWGMTIASQTADYANEAHSLGSALTYYFYPTKYLSGYGLGNCYIAELYQDFSMGGVIVGNIILGAVLAFISGVQKNKLWRNFICIFFVILILRLPRDSFDYPLVNLINLKNILFIVLISLITKRLSKVRSISNSYDELGGINIRGGRNLI